MGRWILIGVVVLAALGSWLAFALLSGDVPRAAAGGAEAAVAGDEERSRAAAELTGDVEARQEEERAASAAVPVAAHADTPRENDPASRAATDRRPLESRVEPFVLEGTVRNQETGDGLPLAAVLVGDGTGPDGDEVLVGGMRGVAPGVFTDWRGRYVLEVEDLELTHVRVLPPEGWNGAELRKPLPPMTAGGRGVVDFELVPWPPPGAGDVRGVLESERGAWTEDTLPAPSTIVLDLVTTTLPRITRRAAVAAVRDATGGLGLTFEFLDVPRGTYQLTLSSLDEYRWAPAELLVAPPAEGLRFLRYDLDRTLPLAFRVVDAVTGEPVEGFEVRHVKTTWTEESGVLLHTGPLEAGDFPLDARFDWSLWADGYAPAFGDETAFAVQDGERVAEVRLARGWGVRLFVLGGEGTKRPIEGATVWLDGDEVGSSGPDGTLDVLRAQRPERIEVRYLDWRLSHDPLQPWQGRPPERRGQVMPVVLEPRE